MEICDRTLSDEIKAALRLPAFDSYEWEDEDVLYLMQTMFIDTGLVDKFNIPLPTLREWLYEVYKHYNAVPFHNFRHCFCVAQMVSQNQTYSQHASFVLCVCVPSISIFVVQFTPQFSICCFSLSLTFICTCYLSAFFCFSIRYFWRVCTQNTNAIMVFPQTCQSNRIYLMVFIFNFYYFAHKIYRFSFSLSLALDFSIFPFARSSVIRTVIPHHSPDVCNHMPNKSVSTAWRFGSVDFISIVHLP